MLKQNKLMSENFKLKEILRDIKLIKFNWLCDCKDCQEIKNRIKNILEKK